VALPDEHCILFSKMRTDQNLSEAGAGRNGLAEGGWQIFGELTMTED
jgi:hypothetical protein